MYAAEFPHRVRSLTLLVPAAVLQLPARGNDQDLFQIVQQKLKARGDPKHMDDYEAFMKRYLDFGSLPNETDEMLASRQAEFAVHYYCAERGNDDAAKKLDANLIGGMACYATFLSMGMEHDYIPVCRGRLAQSTLSVSIVHGSKDMVPESTTRKYVDLFRKGNVKFYTAEDADHDLYDRPQVVDIVKETIERVPTKLRLFWRVVL
jgi:pimeloyl-ACP methyl ester carboxylesterase